MILHGDCLEQLKTLDDNSVDTVITDPPYGYSFMGKAWDKAVPSVEIWQECLRVLKPGGFMCVMSAPRSDVLSRMIVKIEDAGFRVDFTPIYWTYASGFPKAGNIGKLVDKRLGAEREVVGKGTRHGGGIVGASTSYEMPPDVPDITAAASPQAKALDGSYAGFQPKPAVEVIIVAMKPLSEKTYVDQALANGHGISWLDDGRIPTGDTVGTICNNRDNTGQCIGHPTAMTSLGGGVMRHSEEAIQSGRFPANLLVSDDVLNDGSVTKSNKSDYNWTPSDNQETPSKMLQSTIKSGMHHGDSGSYSRYFDLDKWAQTLPFLIVPKASKSEKNKGLEDITCTHPTVKPIRLMSYLITLFSRPGDTVLDPFVGSGTTAVAAQQLGRVPLGIEREAEYVEIAQARLKHITEPTHTPLPQLAPEKPEPAVPPVTLDAFDGIADMQQLPLL